MDKKIKYKWVKALRSGKYTQGVGMLRSISNNYCCLGVLADVMSVGWADYNDHAYQLDTGDGGQGVGTITRPLMETAGLNQDNLNRLIEMNDDDGVDFQGIANHIEGNL